MRDFRNLREQLLRAGIAPRHVSRYLAELRHHYDDLIAEEHAHGINGPAAHEAANARLGSNDELAASVLAKPELRSITARIPWLVFGILPPLATIMCLVVLLIVMVLVAIWGGAIVPDHPQKIPTWFAWFAQGVMLAINFLVIPLLGWLLAWAALRQRMKPLWPLLGISLILMLNVHGHFRIEGTRVGADVGTIIPFKSPFGPGGVIDWAAFLAQAGLLCLPLAWLWRSRHKTIAAQ